MHRCMLLGSTLIIPKQLEVKATLCTSRPMMRDRTKIPRNKENNLSQNNGPPDNASRGLFTFGKRGAWGRVVRKMGEATAWWAYCRRHSCWCRVGLAWLHRRQSSPRLFHWSSKISFVLPGLREEFFFLCNVSWLLSHQLYCLPQIEWRQVSF